MSTLEESSSSVVRFRPHIEAGLEIVSDLEATLLSLNQFCSEKLSSLSLQKIDSTRKLEHLKTEMAEVTNALKSEIRGLQDEIEKVVSNGIRDEIETIQQVVFDFDDAQFIHDPTVVHVYTQQLIRFVVVFERNIMMIIS